MEIITTSVGIIIAVIGILASAIAIYEFLLKVKLNRFQVETIKMKKPFNDNGNFIREPFDPKQLKFLSYENTLRKFSYANTPLPTNNSFYDDSDMSSEYNLIVVYDRKKEIPLLSARVYWNTNDIMTELRGDNKSLEFKIRNPVTDKYEDWHPGEITKSEFGECFAVDRMSGKMGGAIFENNKSKIFGLLYGEIYKNRKKSKAFYALARRDTNEKLLSNYRKLGMKLIGMTHYYGQDHWVLEGRFDDIYEHFEFLRIIAKSLKNHKN